MMLRISVLGELRLERDGREIPPPRGEPARLLLGWLAVKPGVHRRSRLAGRFWPETSEETARTNLRSALANLRRCLGESCDRYVTATRETVGLVEHEVEVDLHRLGRLSSDGRVDEALALARGELLHGLDADWVHEARSEHEWALARILAGAAAQAERDGDLARAVERSRRLVALDPLAEGPARDLIRRLHAAGERSAALAAYTELERRLEAGLGVAPGPDTRALADEVRRGIPLLREGAPAPVATGAGETFVGRRRELDALESAWRRARAGRRSLVFVTGEPGIGKTSLAARFCRLVCEDGGVALSGRCEPEALGPYTAFREALDGVARGLDGDALAERVGEAAFRELRALLPGLDAGSGRGPPAGDAAEDRFRLFESVGAMVGELAAFRPLLLVLDDLHWADRSTLLLLGHLIRSTASVRLLVLGTYRHVEVGRDHPLSALLAHVRREHPYETLYLAGLTETEVGELLEQRGEGDADAARILSERTSGNPFFVAELLRERRSADGPGRTPARGRSFFSTPRGVKEVVSARIAGLGDTAAQVLLAAAVAGRSFELRVLEGMLPHTGDELLEAIESAAAAELVHELREPVGAFTFAHALVRDALYEDLSVVRRVRLHARAAAAIEALGAEQQPELLPQLAHHYREAMPETGPEKAVEYLRRAGAWALRRFGYEEAALLLDDALDVVAGGGGIGDDETLELLMLSGEAYLRAGEPGRARERFGRAAAVARERGDARSLARAALGLGGLAITILDTNWDAVALLEEAAEALDPDADAALLSRVLGRTAVELYYEKPPDRSIGLSERALAVAGRADDRAARIDAAIARRVALWRADRLEQRREISERIVELAVAAEDGERELDGRGWLIVDLAEAGELASVRTQLDAFEELADRLRLPAHSWYVPMWKAMLATVGGDYPLAEGLMHRARELGARAEDRNAEVFFWVQLNTLWWFTAPERARPDAMPDRYGSPADGSTRAARAAMLAQAGRRDDALEDVRYVLADDLAVLFPDVNWLGAVSLLSYATTEIGFDPPLERLYALLRPYAGRLTIQARAVSIDGAVDYFLARLAAGLDALAEAESHYDAAEALYERIDARHLLARSRAEHAALLRRRGGAGRRARARELATLSAAALAELGVPR